MSQTVVNTHLANDIFLCYTNNVDIYRKYSQPRIEAFKAEHATGNYNHTNAAIVWYNILNSGLFSLSKLCVWDRGTKANSATLYAAAGFISDYYLEAITE